jgi:hypothetical protein
MSVNAPGLFYEVRAMMSDARTADEWLSWMRDKHLADVVTAGARRGRVVRLDDSPLSFAAQYEFADRAVFERYLQDHAPRLRAEGLARFGDRVQYKRSSGDIVCASA